MTDTNVEMDSTHRGPDSDVEDVEVVQDTSAMAMLTVGAIKGKCPPHGSEVAVVYNFRTAWVRNALVTNPVPPRSQRVANRGEPGAGRYGRG